MSRDAAKLEKSLLPATLEEYLDAARSSVSPRETVTIPRRRLHDALKWQVVLEKCLASVGTQNHQATSTISEITNGLSVAKQAIEANRKFFNAHIGQDLIAMAPSETSPRAAEHVFSIPELAEMILTYLSARDVFNATRATKAFANCLETSAKLETILGLRLGTNSFWKTYFSKRPAVGKNRGPGLAGISCEFTYRALPGGRLEEEINVYGRVYLGNISRRNAESVPHIGTRIRAMLICQPPIYEVKMIPSCCGTLEHRCTTLQSKVGITVDDLLKSEEALYQEHYLCPFASGPLHDSKTGEVDFFMRFTGTLTLRADDPLFRRTVRPQMMSQGSSAPRTAWDLEVAQYVCAKQLGKPIDDFVYLT